MTLLDDLSGKHGRGGLATLSWLGWGLALARSSGGRNPRAAFLTLLAFGGATASLVIVATLLSGLDRTMTARIATLAPDVLYLATRGSPIGLGDPGGRARAPLTLDDAEAIGVDCRSVVDVSPVAAARLPIAAGQTEGDERLIQGLGEAHLRMARWAVERGRPFQAGEALGRERVCLLGPGAAATLFADLDPVGRRVQIGSWSYAVIGVLAPDSQGRGPDPRDAVIVPVHTLLRQLGGRAAVDFIALRPRSPAHGMRAHAEIDELMRCRRGLPPDAPPDFEVYSRESLIEFQGSLSRAISGVAILVGGMGLLLGGVGIHGLVTGEVRQRTAWIGIQRAAGTRRSEILAGFLAAALAIAATGGSAGVLLGGLLGILVHPLAELPGGPAVGAALTALGLSLGSGLFFGLPPAWRAMRQSPIEVLKRA